MGNKLPLGRRRYNWHEFLTQEEITYLNSLFYSSAGPDGRMNREEFTCLYRRMNPHIHCQTEIDRAFLTADQNRDGYINRDEFYASYVLSKPKHSHIIQQNFTYHQVPIVQTQQQIPLPPQQNIYSQTQAYQAPIYEYQSNQNRSNHSSMHNLSHHGSTHNLSHHGSTRNLDHHNSMHNLSQHGSCHDLRRIGDNGRGSTHSISRVLVNPAYSNPELRERTESKHSVHRETVFERGTALSQSYRHPPQPTLYPRLEPSY